MDRHSKVIKSQSYRWEEIPLREYKNAPGSHRGITRQTLIGEGELETGTSFITRYFEIDANGRSSLEKHEHQHSVIVIRGSGRVLLDDQVHELEPFDCVYIGPNTLHQFAAGASEPLGFLCVVDRDRDRPQTPSREEHARLRSNPETRRFIEG